MGKPDARETTEQSILGGVILRADVLALMPHLEVTDFRNARARDIWTAIRNLEVARQPIDVTMIERELERTGRLDTSTLEYLGECAIRVPTPENVVHYAAELRDMALVERVRSVGEQLTAASRSSTTGADLLALAYSELSRLSVEVPDQALPIGEIVRRRVADLERIAERRARGESAMTGCPTGSQQLDERIGGWQPTLNIVAARPGMGKSSMALASADASTAAGQGVHYFSMEDGDAAMADRAMARDSGVAATRIRACDLNRDEMAALGQSMGRLWKRKNWLYDGRSGLTAEEVVRSVRRRRKANGTRLVIVDYAQKLRAPRNSRMNEYETLNHVVETLADAAQQDGLAYLLLSQLNRECEKRVDKRPTLADMRGSGAIEQCGKIVIGLYRGSYYSESPQQGIDWECTCAKGAAFCEHRPSDADWERTVQLIVLKQNQGPTGVIYEHWDGPTTRIG